MSDRSLVSIIMPAYNASAFIADAIRSILAQKHRPLEVIVVDDGSTDDTAAIVATFGDPVRYHWQANAGPPNARNRGLALTSGEFVSFLDADDLFEPNKLAQQLPRVKDNPSVEVVLGGLRHFDQGDPTGGCFHAAPMPHGDQITLQLSCGLFRRSAFDRVGRFDETMQQCDDWDWFMRARELGIGLLLHRDAVVNHRLHGGNITRDRLAVARFQAMMFKRSLDRRRNGQGAAATLPPLNTFFEPESAEGLGNRHD